MCQRVKSCQTLVLFSGADKWIPLAYGPLKTKSVAVTFIVAATDLADMTTNVIALAVSVSDWPSCGFILQLEVRVCDRAPNPRCAAQNGIVNINIIRNIAPYFVDLPYDRNLDLQFTAGVRVVDVQGRDDNRPVSFKFITIRSSVSERGCVSVTAEQSAIDQCTSVTLLK